MQYLMIGLFAMGTLAQTPPPIPMSPTDTIGFDYEDAELINAQVVRFERKSGTGNWADIGIPITVANGAPVGWSTYKFVPTAPLDTPTTIYFRACNAAGCSVSTDPFTFVRQAIPALLIERPSNVRRIPGT